MNEFKSCNSKKPGTSFEQKGFASANCLKPVPGIMFEVHSQLSVVCDILDFLGKIKCNSGPRWFSEFVHATDVSYQDSNGWRRRAYEEKFGNAVGAVRT